MAHISKFVIESDFRKEREKLGELAMSIKKFGLLQPILVRRSGDEYIVQAGRSRLIAMRDYLRYTSLEEGVHFIVNNETDELIAQLEENLQRSDLKPVEAARLIKAIHERQVSKFGRPIRAVKGGWRLEDTAKLLGKGKSFVSKMLKIADNEDLVKDCGSLASAITTIDRKQKKDMLETVQKVRAKRATLDISSFLSNFECADALNFLSSIEDSSIDLILTDPPYGVGLDEITDGFGKYDDAELDVKELMTECMPHFKRVLRDGKFMVVWTSFFLFPWLRGVAESAGFYVPAIPIIWVKPSSVGRSQEPQLRLGCSAECALYAYSSADACLSKIGRSNLFNFPPVPTPQKIHVAMKPEALLTEVIETFSIKGDVVLDVFAGSASTARACWRTGRKFIGCEKEEATYNSALTYTMDWINAFDSASTK